jgi:hypothetical protein
MLSNNLHIKIISRQKLKNRFLSSWGIRKSMRKKINLYNICNQRLSSLSAGVNPKKLVNKSIGVKAGAFLFYTVQKNKPY